MKQKLFGNRVPPNCSYCTHGKKGKNGFGCEKGKRLSEEGKCRAFCYDPLKRSPQLPNALPKYNPEDFLL